ncbi:MAG: hypothetical protein ACLTOV_07775 [Phocaeicola sp.]
MSRFLILGVIPVMIIFSSCATASFSKYKGVGRIKQYELYSEHLPEAFDGFRLAFASDFHYESRFTTKRLHGMVSALQQMQADILLLGGDYRRGVKQRKCWCELFVRIVAGSLLRMVPLP